MQYIKKNELKPHLSKYWKIPPDCNAEFVAKMGGVSTTAWMQEVEQSRNGYQGAEALPTRMY